MPLILQDLSGFQKDFSGFVNLGSCNAVVAFRGRTSVDCSLHPSQDYPLGGSQRESRQGWYDLRLRSALGILFNAKIQVEFCKKFNDIKLFRLIKGHAMDSGLPWSENARYSLCVPTYRHQFLPVCLKKNIYIIQKFGLENVYKFASILLYFGNGVAFGSR